MISIPYVSVSRADADDVPEDLDAFSQMAGAVLQSLVNGIALHEARIILQNSKGERQDPSLPIGGGGIEYSLHRHLVRGQKEARQETISQKPLTWIAVNPVQIQEAFRMCRQNVTVKSVFHTLCSRIVGPGFRFSHNGRPLRSVWNGQKQGYIKKFVQEAFLSAVTVGIVAFRVVPQEDVHAVPVVVDLQKNVLEFAVDALGQTRYRVIERHVVVSSSSTTAPAFFGDQSQTSESLSSALPVFFYEFHKPTYSPNSLTSTGASLLQMFHLYESVELTYATVTRKKALPLMVLETRDMEREKPLQKLDSAGSVVAGSAASVAASAAASGLDDLMLPSSALLPRDLDMERFNQAINNFAPDPASRSDPRRLDKAYESLYKSEEALTVVDDPTDHQSRVLEVRTGTTAKFPWGSVEAPNILEHRQDWRRNVAIAFGVPVDMLLRTSETRKTDAEEEEHRFTQSIKPWALDMQNLLASVSTVMFRQWDTALTLMSKEKKRRLDEASKVLTSALRAVGTKTSALAKELKSRISASENPSLVDTYNTEKIILHALSEGVGVREASKLWLVDSSADVLKEFSMRLKPKEITERQRAWLNILHDLELERRLTNWIADLSDAEARADNQSEYEHLVQIMDIERQICSYVQTETCGTQQDFENVLESMVKMMQSLMSKSKFTATDSGNDESVQRITIELKWMLDENTRSSARTEAMMQRTQIEMLSKFLSLGHDTGGFVLDEDIKIKHKSRIDPDQLEMLFQSRKDVMHQSGFFPEPVVSSLKRKREQSEQEVEAKDKVSRIDKPRIEAELKSKDKETRESAPTQRDEDTETGTEGEKETQTETQTQEKQQERI